MAIRTAVEETVPMQLVTFDVAKSWTDSSARSVVVRTVAARLALLRFSLYAGRRIRRLRMGGGPPLHRRLHEYAAGGARTG
jgi:hypothetical protein